MQNPQKHTTYMPIPSSNIIILKTDTLPKAEITEFDFRMLLSPEGDELGTLSKDQGVWTFLGQEENSLSANELVAIAQALNDLNNELSNASEITKPANN